MKWEMFPNVLVIFAPLQTVNNTTIEIPMLQLGVDESYNLLISKAKEGSVAGEVTIEANTVYGALRGLEERKGCIYLDDGQPSMMTLLVIYLV
ncbi:uncharacterized protein LOC130714238 isoform X2 [Lotus japonicus]|uniref:uncharacterized protein LOC130714238 isoform X2 n=1 Tax=Lotus japonicus TaxID=34305 RepID=UPI00259066A5|nr:uncharacterized protein LOC130714238 isoform X2 [Lotus japonicus]